MYRQSVRGSLCLLLLLGCVVAAEPAWAQRSASKQSKEDDDARERERRKKQRQADNALNARIQQLREQAKRVFETGAFDNDQQRQTLRQMFDVELQRMQLPYNYESERLVTRVVQRILNTLQELGRLNNSAAHEEAVQHLLQQLPALVEKKDAPLPVRYNAVLLIGLLNQREPQDQQAPIPLQEAVPVLLDIVTDAKKHPVAIRVGALVGLERHTRYGRIADPQLAARLQRTLLQLLEKGWPDLESSPPVQVWVRTRAAEALGNLRLANIAGTDGFPVVERLYQVAANEQEDHSLRIAALEALSRLDLSQVQGLNPMLLAQTAVELIHRSISREVPLDLMYRQVQADVARLLLVFWGTDGQGGFQGRVRGEQERRTLAEAVQALQRLRDILGQRVPTDRRDPEREKELQEEFFDKLKSDLEAEAEELNAWLEKNPRQGKLLQGG